MYVTEPLSLSGSMRLKYARIYDPQATGQAPLSGLYPMKAGVYLSDAISFPYRQLEEWSTRLNGG